MNNCPPRSLEEIRNELIAEARVRLAELKEESDNQPVMVTHRPWVVRLGGPLYLGAHLTHMGKNQPRSRHHAYRLTHDEAEGAAAEIRSRGGEATVVSRRRALDLDIADLEKTVSMLKEVD